MAKFSPQSILPRLDTQAFGIKLYTFEEVGSTNEVAHELARNGAPHGTIVIADSQTRGKGRLERRWISPPGVNLYISFVLRPHMPIVDVPFITFTAAIALSEAISSFGVDSSIKWPNDVLVGGKKVAGILTEAEPDNDKVSFVVLGAGVNINMTREMLAAELGDVAAGATSLLAESGSSIDRSHFAVVFINQMERWYGEFVNLGKDHIIREWTRRCGMIGRRVEIRCDDKVLKGTAQGINPSGYLLVKTEDGSTEKVVAGDIVIL
jgi:BirA family biotin operon repressor/biotin-[acetyl-CoA-carboxylase] ligase